MWIVWLLVALVALVALYIFAIAPKKWKGEALSAQTLYAHRGLFNNEDIPENSLPAFRKAVEKMYGIELDVHITSDGKLIVFHDDDLKRMCGVSGAPEKSDFEALMHTPLIGTQHCIPSFEQVLATVDGKVPLIVEIKGLNFDVSVCEKTAEMLDGYDGAYCIESFNPMYVRWFKKNRPHVMRGQLTGHRTRAGAPFGERVRDVLLRGLMLNFLSRPHFVAIRRTYAHRLSFRLTKRMGALPVAWTVRSPQELEQDRHVFKLLIFERFEAK